jgi:hypothetical protein
VKVASELARRGKRGRDVDALHSLGQFRGQQSRLHAFREAQLTFEARFVRGDLLVQPRVLDGDGGLAREKRQDLDLAL